MGATPVSGTPAGVRDVLGRVGPGVVGADAPRPRANFRHLSEVRIIDPVAHVYWQPESINLSVRSPDSKLALLPMIGWSRGENAISAEHLAG